jgi:hypothetical protein
VALDASTWLEQGINLSEVRTKIEKKYAAYGPGTDALPVP